MAKVYPETYFIEDGAEASLEVAGGQRLVTGQGEGITVLGRGPAVAELDGGVGERGFGVGHAGAPVERLSQRLPGPGLVFLGQVPDAGRRRIAAQAPRGRGDQIRPGSAARSTCRRRSAPPPRGGCRGRR